MATSLGNIIEKFQFIRDEEVLAIILKSVSSALEYFHSNNQMHRDVKAANILIDKHGVIKLSDFGVAGKISVGKAKTLVGSPC